ncbi:hypothetical protein VTO42DRAFT_7120 [Malbranchea cinnamomea]
MGKHGGATALTTSKWEGGSAGDGSQVIVKAPLTPFPTKARWVTLLVRPPQDSADHVATGPHRHARNGLDYMFRLRKTHRQLNIGEEEETRLYQKTWPVKKQRGSQGKSFVALVPLVFLHSEDQQWL